MTQPGSHPLADPVPSDPPEKWPLPPEPDISHIITETEEPVDNILSEKQMRLLVEPLFSCWSPGREFLAAANVGIFSALHRPPIVPDMFLSMDVRVPDKNKDPWAKKNRSYFIWEFGKPPEVAVEIVSNSEGGELDRKLAEYARMRIAYYAVYDPAGQTSETPLQFFVLIGDHFEPASDPIIPPLDLGLRLWSGEFEGTQYDWIRWFTLSTGTLIPTGAERADREAERAAREAARADQEASRALREEARANQEAERALREQARAQAAEERIRELERRLGPDRPE